MRPLAVAPFRSYIKIRIFGRDRDEAEEQPGGIPKYVEDLRRGLNTDIGRTDFFEMASNLKVVCCWLWCCPGSSLFPMTGF